MYRGQSVSEHHFPEKDKERWANPVPTLQQSEEALSHAASQLISRVCSGLTGIP